MIIIAAHMKLEFERCQIYKLNISVCLTKQEQDYYNLYCDGISSKALKERLGIEFPTLDTISKEFHISSKEAENLLNCQFEKNSLSHFFVMRLKNFQKRQFVRFVRVQYIFVMKKGTLRIPLRMKSGLFGSKMNVSEDVILTYQRYRS